MSDLSGRTTVVVGASRDLERGIARAFAEAGGGQLGKCRAGGSRPGRRRQPCDASAPVPDVGDVLCQRADRRQDRVHLAA